jgi:hypothetical protein
MRASHDELSMMAQRECPYLTMMPLKLLDPFKLFGTISKGNNTSKEY